MKGSPGQRAIPRVSLYAAARVNSLDDGPPCRRRDDLDELLAVAVCPPTGYAHDFG